MMNEPSRRKFLRRAGVGLAAVPLAGEALAQKAKSPKLTLGMASYTFRKFDLEKTLAMTKRLGLKQIAFKDFHLPMDSTPEVIRAAAVKTRDAGLELYGCGVVYMKTEAEVNRAFDYAKTAGMAIIIGVPEHGLLDLVNRKAQEYNIKVAIHNHGPGDKVYPSPQTAYDKIRDLDPRMGLCLDIGHAQRLGVDPSEAARKFSKRLLDVHIKDVSSSSAEGTTVEIGRGVIDIPRFLRTLIELRYTGTLALEYEKDENDPLPGAAESIGYLRGALELM
ncbi:MAG: sugar phosphate isomerase/epimerase [Candidatus Latescibacter sp.]|nr:sugar phosphate isomerase/epimerase [Candidatus Latescibacter sp.]